MKITYIGATAWGRGGRVRGGRGGRDGANYVLGSGVTGASYAPGVQGIDPELREVVNILGKRNQAGTLTGIHPPPGSIDDNEEEEETPKKPPRPLYIRLIEYVRQAWTGVKFALGK